MHVLDFLTELQNTEVQSDSTTDALTAISKILGAYKESTCGGVKFCDSSGWVDWTAQIF